MSESLILLFVIVAQSIAMFLAWRSAKALKALVPTRARLSVEASTRPQLPDDAHELAERDTEAYFGEPDEDVTPRILVDEPSDDFRQIVFDLNDYARINRGAASDFALVKDVVDRPIDSAIARAEAWVSVPLYLGLAGALTGIIFGVRAMSQGVLAKAAQSGPAVNGGDTMSQLTGNLDELLNAVAWAMGASLAGVVFTLFLSWVVSDAVNTVDKNRNQFFTFYQTQFLPRITRDVNSVLASLNGTLDRFNTQFGGNVAAMQDSFRQNTTAIEAQARTLQAMRELSVGGALEKTIELYKGLEQAIATVDGLRPHIERSSAMMKMVGDASDKFVQSAGSVVKLNKLTEDIAALANRSVEIQNFVGVHLADLKSGSANAEGIGQRIVEQFDKNFGEFQDQLRTLTGELRNNVEVIQRASDLVRDEAAANLRGLPLQLDGMVQDAFDTKTVRAIKDSAEQASRASREAQLEASKNLAIRGEIFEGLAVQREAVTRTIDRLDEVAEHMDASNEAMRRLLNPIPWYKRLFSGGGPYGPSSN